MCVCARVVITSALSTPRAIWYCDEIREHFRPVLIESEFIRRSAGVWDVWVCYQRDASPTHTNICCHTFDYYMHGRYACNFDPIHGFGRFLLDAAAGCRFAVFVMCCCVDIAIQPGHIDLIFFAKTITHTREYFFLYFSENFGFPKQSRAENERHLFSVRCSQGDGGYVSSFL